MQRDERIYDLDQIVRGRGLPKVRVHGKEIEVHPLDGASLLLLAQLDEAGPAGVDHIRVMYQVTEQILPELTHDEVLRMTPEQINVVTSIAQNKIEQVRKLLEAFEKSSPQ